MKTSLVIPVWNDPNGLRQLLTQAIGMGLFSQIIIVDDASDPPCDPNRLGIQTTARGLELVYLRNPRNQGAGHARNIGLKHVTGSHVLFFDSDDQLRPELIALIRSLSGHSFDFCLFKHGDSRQLAAGLEAPLPLDDEIWNRAGATRPLDQLSPAQAEALCLISAYPWNKIYRTGFLHDNQICCTEIPVHNDAELHWVSFIKAQTILYSNQPCCRHFVHENGQRLTNRRQQERLEVFQALNHICDAIEQTPGGGRFLVPYLTFCNRLFHWITHQALDPELHAPFLEKARDFLLHRVRPEYLALLNRHAPESGVGLNAVLAGHLP